MNKHTPEPWRLVDDAQGPCMILDRGGVCIASLTNAHIPVKGFIEIESPGAPTRTANARLIAAAPKMLAALRRFVDLDTCDCYLDGEHHTEPCVWCQAKEALSKAEGRTG
jgi:hypothetical protein